MELNQLVIICTTIIICIGILIFGIMGFVAFQKAEKGTAKSFGLMFQRGNFLRISTVLMVVIAIIYLGITGIIKENGIIGILGGITGYVLGSLEKSNKEQDNNE